VRTERVCAVGVKSEQKRIASAHQPEQQSCTDEDEMMRAGVDCVVKPAAKT
jgi:hypothetical protein